MKKGSLTQTGTLKRAESRSRMEAFYNQLTKITLAHEVRNPLTNITLAVGMLRTVTNIDHLGNYLDIISRASWKIEGLINSLLSPSRNGKKQFEKHSIQKLLDEVLASTGDRIALKHIDIRKEYALQDCEIALNEPEMKIALTNLIVNAIDAITGEGGTIKIRTESNENKFIIQIADNGCGISNKDLKNIFKPYFTNKPGGFGLGLAATSAIVRSNHGTIKVKSAENNGTCFEIFLDKNYSPAQEIANNERHKKNSPNRYMNHSKQLRLT